MISVSAFRVNEEGCSVWLREGTDINIAFAPAQAQGRCLTDRYPTQ